MRLVVGLGNPTGDYAATRHNVGFRVVDTLAARWSTAFGSSKFPALVAPGRRNDDKVKLVKPQTYMNESGRAVGPLAQYFRVAPADVLVVYDDVDLPLGQLRLRAQGSAGTHNGMKSIIQHVGTQAFPRLRVGIGRAGRQSSLTRHVLGKFARAERPTIDAAVERAADCVERVLDGDWDGAMTTYNERLGPLESKEDTGS